MLLYSREVKVKEVDVVVNFQLKEDFHRRYSNDACKINRYSLSHNTLIGLI